MDLSKLNPQQRAAITAADGAHLVVAGAGTGKTRTLVHRVAWLIDQGIDPRSIALLTFTRRAAQEMLSRAAALVGAQARLVRGGTFHGFAAVALRRYAKLLGYTNRFTILDRSDSEALIGLVRSAVGAGGQGRRFPKRNTIAKLLSKQVNTHRSLAEIIEEEYPQYLEDTADIERIGKRYAERKLQNDVMDFDDLLVKLAELLTEHPTAHAKLSGACRHVLIDEYQDTNRIQAKIACFLAAAHGNLVVVGDEAQSIYRFRGAVVENILDFPSLFPDCSTLLLEQNYRSTQPVLDFANAVLESARDRYDKRLFTNTPGGHKPQVVRVAEESEQPGFIVEKILELREEGVDLQEIAVLFRSSYHANLLELELAQANLPFKKFGGIQFVEAAHIKDVFALLRLVANPRDGVSWFRVLQWFDGLGAKSAQTIGDAVVKAKRAVFDPTPFAKRRYGADLKSLADWLDEAANLFHDLPALVDHTVDWVRGHIERRYEDHVKRLKDLETLSILATKHSDLESFLAQVSLEPPDATEVSPTDSEDEWLTLSTVHSAKGLEWDTVFMLQLADGHFPSGYSLEDDDLIEEERRLFYVAVTRAKHHLFLMQPRFVRGRWGPAVGPGCTLLDEIHDLEHLVEEVRWVPHVEQLPEDPELTAAKARLDRFLDYFS